ncbi:uncharacterized protein N7511_006307 [Penicillium nucicola]|uniref:uncharacterized protein n=1 Tax=Penicillium nucicola TaxID=1850975 RepID=UPI00254562BD|nr:uncharacterized protein N7511_006307 [Penicillium nucicola]KAJ5757613.1 hypothetical protein N7511_006307 [Penicillium nucicola]
MRRFRTVFRSSRSDNPDNRSRAQRRTSDNDPLKPKPETLSQETRPDESPVKDLNVLTSGSKPPPATSVTSVGERTDDSPPAPLEPEHTPLRPKYGTKRLKRIVARFRSSHSHDEDPAEGPFQSVGVQTDNTEPIVPDSTEPSVSGNADPASNPLEQAQVSLAQESPPKLVRFDDNPQVVGEGERKVSTQSTESQESSQTEDTICRHTTGPDLIPTPTTVSSDEWSWSGLMYHPEDGTHIREGSNPFSDGKSTEPQLGQPSSSKRHDRSREHSKASESSLDPILEEHDKIAPAPIPQRPGFGPMINNLTWMREPCQFEPSKAAVILNKLIVRFDIPMPKVLPEPEGGLPEIPLNEGSGNGRRGFRLMNRVRKVRSGLVADAGPQERKLRRVKTFAVLRRPVPMTSLYGRSVETLARLGGHSFLMLADLAPFPLQLPACIVAPVMFLHKYGANMPGIFTNAGDVKAATRLYDNFASQVLSAEKEEAKISMTMRIVSMPHLNHDSAPVLSVAWTLKALLAGLHYGILGSVRLYQTLSHINLATIPQPVDNLHVPDCLSMLGPRTAIRVQLIALAVIALTDEMERELICAVFGLLTKLTRVPEPKPGTEVRTVATDLGLERVFGPLLLGAKGQENQDGVPVHIVEQEIEEQRVAKLLMDHWYYVNRLLREWAKGERHQH